MKTAEQGETDEKRKRNQIQTQTQWHTLRYRNKYGLTDMTNSTQTEIGNFL